MWSLGGTMSKKSLPADALLGGNIKKYRLQRGLTLSEFARQLEVSFQQIQKYEQGINRVGAGRLSEIARILGVPVVSLFKDDEARERREFGRGDPAPWARALPVQPDELRLLKAFHQIARGNLRLAIVRLVEAMGEPRPPRGALRRAASGFHR